MGVIKDEIRNILENICYLTFKFSMQRIIFSFFLKRIKDCFYIDGFISNKFSFNLFLFQFLYYFYIIKRYSLKINHYKFELHGEEKYSFVDRIY